MNITYEDFNHICRLCLTKTHDFTSVLQFKDVEMLEKLGVSIEITKFDELPQKTCKQCEKKIKSIFTFIGLCKTNYDILRSILIQEKEVKYKLKDLYVSSGNEFEYRQDNAKNNINNEINELSVSLINDFDNHKQTVEIISAHQDTDKGNNPQDLLLLEKFGTEDAGHHLPVQDKRNFKPGKTKIICKKCKLTFKSKMGLGAHYKKNVECRPLTFKLYTCEYCGKEFLRLRDKMQHENIHTGITPYNCSYCEKRFKCKINLTRHIHRHKRKLGLVEQLELRCDKCEKVFASQSGIRRHKLKHEGKSSKRNEMGPDKNQKDFLCNYCAMSFYIKANLVTHLRVHTGERPYKCNQCDQRFKQKCVLDRHTLNHLDVRPKPFICEICQKGFTTKSHMEIHKRLHTGDKPFECHFCKKTFNYKTTWRIHLRMHTGESPFVCSICNQSYFDKGSLRKHLRAKGHIMSTEQAATKELGKCKDVEVENFQLN